MDDAPTLSPEALLSHAGWARALARRLVADEQRADDVVQQAWLAVVQRPPRQPSPLQPHSEARVARAWLGRVIRNVAWKQHREDARRETRERAAAVPEAQPSSSAIVAELAAQRLVVDALMRLDEPYRETLVRRWYRDEKPAAIARAMDVPVRTVETRLARGLERLRAELTLLRGGDRRAWGLALVPLAVHAPGAAGAVGAAGAAGAGTVLGTLAAGVGAMSVTMKIAAAVVVAAAVGFGWWWLRGEGTGGRGGLEVAGARRTAAAADAGPPDSSVEAAPARVAEPLPNGEVAGLKLSLRVLRSDGTPVDSGQVVLFEGEEVLGLGSIREGAVEPPLPVPPRAASAIVEVVETMPRLVAIPAGAREQTIRLPEEGVLSGRFVVDGGPPPERLSIAFHGSYLASLVGTPQSAWIALQARDAEKNGDGNFRTSFPRAGLPRVRAIERTDAEGRFRFEGLEPGSRGRLLAPHGFTFTPVETGFDGGRSALQELEVVVGAAPLVFELHPVPAVAGRIVDGEGIPVRDVRVLLRGMASGGAFTSSDRTNDAGRFRVGLWNGAPTSATVDCFDPANGGHVRRALRHPFKDGADVGDLVLARALWIALKVRDPEGRSIERYGVAAELPDGWQRLRAADDGSGQWPAPAGTTRLRVAAAGFDPEIVDLGDLGERESDATLELEVDLERATELVVELRGADGSPVPGLMVQLVGRPGLFRTSWLDAERRTSDTVSLDESTDTQIWSDAGSAHADQFADESGTARFGGLLAGVPIDVRVLGGMQEPVFETTLQIGRGETRELVVPLPAPRSWHGQVVDESGTPILAAGVHLRRLDREHHGHFLGPAIGTVTGSDGKFRFDRLLVDEAISRNYVVEALAGGFGRFQRRLENLATGDSSTIVLRPEWPLVVEVVDDRGAPVKSAYVTAKPAISQPELGESMLYAASPMPSDDHRFSTLPPDPVDIRVEVGGREYSRRVEPPTPRVRFEVPSASRVVVRYDLPIPEAARAGRVLGAIELVPSGGDGTAVTTDTTIYDPPRREGAVEFEEVLPGTYEVVLVWRDDEGNDLDRETTAETLRVEAAATLEITLSR